MNNLLKNKTFVNLLSKMPTIRQSFFTILGMVLLVFLFLSLLSHNVNDPTWSHAGNTGTTTNITGRLGAWISDILRVFFGYGSWWLIIVIGYELMRLWWKHEKLAWQLRSVAYGFLLIFISALLASWGESQVNNNALWTGGVIGLELYKGLVVIFGKAISTLFLVVMIVFVGVLTLGINVGRLFGKGKKPPELIAPITTTPKESDKILFDLINQPKKPHHPVVNPDEWRNFIETSGVREMLLKKQAPSVNEPLAQETPHTPEKSYATDYGIQVTQVQPVGVTLTSPNNNKPKKTAKKPEIFVYEPPKNTVHSDPPKPTAQAKTPASFDDSEADTDDPFVEIKQPLTGSPLDSIYEEDPFIVMDISDKDNFPAVIDEPSESDEPVAPPQQPHQTDRTPAKKPDLLEEFDPQKPKSRAMSTLEYRMSLTPIPELSLLDPPSDKQAVYSPNELAKLSQLLQIKLQEFNISAVVVSAMVGPVVTRFEVELAAGVKVSRVTKIAQDLARSMSMTSLRVLPVIAGKPYIGIEVPNRHRNIVSLIELLDTPAYQDPNAGISIAIGADIGGNPVIADLAKAPHMLVAGTTGSGKSVLVNSFLLSMLLKYTPDELKLVLIDPKQLELANYADIPHLLTPVITDMTEATAVLNWCVGEMERRYKLIGLLRVRQLTEFNKKVQQAEAMGEPLLDPLWNAADHVGDAIPRLKPLPKIVVVADEFADMIMQLGKTAEEPIVRLAQKARAAGIHLILATQRPVANVVTGLIKSNVPSRVALRVNSAIDSRLIIEEAGAENMLGHGDMMFIAPGKNETERVHGAYVKDDEVNRITDAWRERGRPDYIDLSNSYSFESEGSASTHTLAGDDDKSYQQAVAYFAETQKVSISSLQRKMFIGYNKAARLVDLMEERGVVSSPDASGKRQLLI